MDYLRSCDLYTIVKLIVIATYCSVWPCGVPLCHGATCYIWSWRVPPYR